MQFFKQANIPRGCVFCSRVLEAVDGDQTIGVVKGEARTVLTDAFDNGVVLFVVWNIDTVSKDVDVRYWEIEPPNEFLETFLRTIL